MGKGIYSDARNNGHIASGRMDNATAMTFHFNDLKCGFQVPDDVTKDEMIECLQAVVTGLQQNKGCFVIPIRYMGVSTIQEKEKREQGFNG